MRFIWAAFLTLNAIFSSASLASPLSTSCEALLRVRDYRSVMLDSLNYDETQIFKDPQDTETISAVGLSAVKPGDRVLELGSGSGIPANAFLSQGRASEVVGLDISEASIEHARRTYGSPKISFHVADYQVLSTQEIVDRFSNGKAPDLVVSNPPYVPSVGHSTGILRTIDGGPDGLRFIRRVIGLASEMNARLAFILGSYSSPLEAFQILREKGYRITKLTFSVLPFGSFSEANRDQILRLEAAGQAFLLHGVFKNRLAYAAIGVVAEKSSSAQVEATRSSQIDLKNLLYQMTHAATTDLETLADSYPIPVRVLVLSERPQK